MNTKNQELYNIIETLPENMLDKVLDYIEYLEFTNLIDIPIKELSISGKKDLRKKLEKGEDDIKNGNVVSIDEAFQKIGKILS